MSIKEHKEYIRHVAGSRSAVLFIHGIIGTPAHFDRLIPAVPDTWSVYSMLLDGHGGTAEDFSNTSMEKWREQVHQAVDDLSPHYENVVIAAHSMGTLFAMENAVRAPEKVKLLFLLACPLFMRPTAHAVKNAIKVLSGRIRPDDAEGLAARDAFGIEPTLRLWKYLGWVPRYLELFREARTVRSIVREITIPCHVFQSGKDELVSPRAAEYLRKQPNITLEILESSRHSYYGGGDLEHLLSSLQSMLTGIK